MANRRVLIGAGVVAGLAAGVAAVPYFIDWGFFEPQMIAAVEAATGYEVEVGGDLRFTPLPVLFSLPLGGNFVLLRFLLLPVVRHDLARPYRAVS